MRAKHYSHHSNKNLGFATQSETCYQQNARKPNLIYMSSLFDFVFLFFFLCRFVLWFFFLFRYCQHFFNTSTFTTVHDQRHQCKSSPQNVRWQCSSKSTLPPVNVSTITPYLFSTRNSSSEF